MDLDELGPFSLRDVESGASFVIEASVSGLVYLAVNLVMVAAKSDHVHLQSRELVPSAGVLDSGVEITIHDLESMKPSSTPRLHSFVYEARPTVSGEPPPFPVGAECLTHRNDGFWLEGNALALLALAQHCLDLAEPGTPRGVELRYVPGSHLEDDSIGFSLKRL